MYGYTENELRALDAADEAFAEVRKVAKNFAKKINATYNRSVNSWTSTSTFYTPLRDALRGNAMKTVEVHNLYDGWNECADNCAWEVQSHWNRMVRRLWLIEDYSLAYDARERVLKEVGRIVERWYELAADCAYETYLDEHAA